MADKVFILAVVGAYWVEGMLHFWEAALVGLRDLTVLAGVAWLAGRGHYSLAHSFAPTLLGKATTGAQFAFVLTVALYARLIPLVFLLTVLLSALAAANYLRMFTAESEPDARPGGSSLPIPHKACAQSAHFEPRR